MAKHSGKTRCNVKSWGDCRELYCMGVKYRMPQSTLAFWLIYPYINDLKIKTISMGYRCWEVCIGTVDLKIVEKILQK